MKTICLTLTALGTLALLAQPGLDRYQFYRLGDAGEYQGVNAENFDPGPSGQGVVWDFSHLQRDSENSYTIRYLEPKDAPEGDAYPDADLVEALDIFGRVEYSYLQTRGNRIFLLGRETTPHVIYRYTDTSFYPDLRLQYGQTHIADMGGVVAKSPGVFLPTSFWIEGETTVAYDGYGTLVLPNGQTVHNVIRVTLTREWVEDSRRGTVFGVFEKKEIRYHYYEPDHSAPLFEYGKMTLVGGASGNISTAGTRKTAAYRVSSESKPLLTAKRGIHLTQDASVFSSRILIHNPTDQNQTVQFQGADEEGVVSPWQERDLPRGSTLRETAMDALGTDASSMVMQGCKDCVLSLDYRGATIEGTSVQVNQRRDYRRQWTFLPGEWDQLFEGQAIVNAGETPIEILATQVDFQGNVLKSVILEESLAPGAKHLSLFNDLFDPHPDSWIQLQSKGLMSVMGLRMSKDFVYLYQNEPLPVGVEPDQTRWLPHLTRENGGFKTDVLISNRGEENAQFLFQPFDEQGQALVPKWIQVPAGQTRRFAKQELFPQETSHASFTGSNHGMVSLVYRANAVDASSAVVHETTPVGTSFKFYRSEGDLLADGLVLINTGDAPANISLSQISDQGSIGATVAWAADLPPNGKCISFLDGQVSGEGPTILKIDSNQPLAVLSLRLSRDNRYLYNNEVLPR